MTDLFYGSSGPRDAAIMAVGEAWGSTEAWYKRPLVGESGKVFDRMLAKAGLDRDDIFCTNIVNLQPQYNDMFRLFVPMKEARANKQEPFRGLHPTEVILDGLARLYEQIEAVNPKVIIALGNYPMWALTDGGSITNSQRPSGWKVPAGIMQWRGSQLYTRDDLPFTPRPCLPTLHPAFIMRNWTWQMAAIHDLRERTPKALTGDWDPPEREFHTEATFEETVVFLESLILLCSLEPLEVSCDIETSRPCITVLGLGISKNRALAIPFMNMDHSSYWSFDEEVKIVSLLRALFLHPNCHIIGQNFIYDTQYIERWIGVRPNLVLDTMMMQHVLFPGLPKKLYFIASLCNEHYKFWKDDLKESEKTGDLQQRLHYNCLDVVHTYEAAFELKRVVENSGLWPQYQFKLREQKELALPMMDRGTLIDKDIRASMSGEVAEAAADLTEWLDKVVPEWAIPPTKSKKAWYMSPHQTRNLLYQSMGLKTMYHRKTDAVTTNTEALELLKVRYPELSQLFDVITDLRSLGVFQNTFLRAPLDPDGRMRCSFNVAGPYTMRWSSSENAFGRGTNLQNIPEGDEQL